MRRQYLDIDLLTTKKLVNDASTLIVDVREPWEFEEYSIGGVNIPLSTIREKRPLLEPFSNIIVICANGTRSKVAAMDFCRVSEWTDKQIYHLKGGILEVE